ncbi:MAG: hypothetical protein IKX37_01390 [Bacteroidales bacterium]|nr:hypothetical protein [Bacteroidales bacterium]
MEISFSIFFREGNEIRVSLSSFSEEALGDIATDLAGIELVDISLVRQQGDFYADWKTLLQIATSIGKFLSENPNAILYYYCDEINPIPHIRPSHNIQPAEYRNRLFSILFQKGALLFPSLEVEDKPIIIKSDEGTAYIHLIYNSCLKEKAQMISDYLLEIAEGIK